MRYSLWSRGRLVGHTDLDIYTVSPTIRQGFIEPAAGGAPILDDATAVWRAMAERKRAWRASGEDDAELNDRVITSLNRREALDLEVRDESGDALECEFMRIYDLFDSNNGVVDDMCDTEDEQQADFEILLSSLAPEDRTEMLAQRAAAEVEIEAFVTELREEREENELFGSSWPPLPAEDPRWDTMRYHLQVYLKGHLDDYAEFLSSED